MQVQNYYYSRNCGLYDQHIAQNPKRLLILKNQYKTKMDVDIFLNSSINVVRSRSILLDQVYVAKKIQQRNINKVNVNPSKYCIGTTIVFSIQQNRDVSREITCKIYW